MVSPSNCVRTPSGSEMDQSRTSRFDPVATTTPREMLARGPGSALGSYTPSLTVGLLPRCALKACYSIAVRRATGPSIRRPIRPSCWEIQSAVEPAHSKRGRGRPRSQRHRALQIPLPLEEGTKGEGLVRHD
jgi:hypothetical protein